MYEYLKGIITVITPAYVVVEVQGVGYQVNVANPYHFKQDEQVMMYVYQAVSETDLSLFGFDRPEDKDLFLNLLRVKGIGPKSALAILANDDHSGLINAINNDDVNYLKKFPKIGPKAAQQIILDLKGKISSEGVSGNPMGESTPVGGPLEEASEALLALGYSAKEVTKVKKQLKQLDIDTTDQYISEALKLLMKG
ncbi:Holliday junction branch migration protein RuvA [Pediococcus argentinicus]|uniref:Holliday junction branch migration complex subunit RuvA n=1 Tax=Pediococcus argentinicus TaxID=480391 RepID=A0A0R2NIV8_9LACO|nr:Holliday junction branch migration protein RuvA [Pediococcus argentinicus]KRO25276.1 Holliday junction DNA helicase subunit RuvA [Pediococcus argentinicus]NKZ22343.1 Holliday junction branch migration protein RuvA [Pediococcus argentinicus]GEP19434.1 Holliday junction ATP-dependent DNA helicase RuvA [Pediococcus argentinicus]